SDSVSSVARGILARLNLPTITLLDNDGSESYVAELGSIPVDFRLNGTLISTGAAVKFTSTSGNLSVDISTWNLDTVTIINTRYVASTTISNLTFSVHSVESNLGDTSSVSVAQIRLTLARTPIILDLDGDGVETIDVSEGVLFDIDGDGDKDNVGWVGKDDGLLVRDINNDGQIDVTELFGDNTVKQDGSVAADGFVAMADLDSNQDGVLDALDDAFSELKVWQDKNSDGVVQEGEMLSLEEAGVSSISLAYTDSSIESNGNVIYKEGTYLDADGNEKELADVWFTYEENDSEESSTIDVLDGGPLLGIDNTFNDIEGSNIISNFNVNDDKLDLSDVLQNDTVSNLADYLELNFIEEGTVISVISDDPEETPYTVLLDGTDLSEVYGTLDKQLIINKLLGDNNDGPLIIGSSQDTTPGSMEALQSQDLDSDEWLL
ncbi:MAG: type I secretion C-terminal target domain-containing protein, partial [Psychrobium sp.]|nr:type I secretion C-terminal target domain-containing protein [Psychrobium sp.]